MSEQRQRLATVTNTTCVMLACAAAVHLGFVWTGFLIAAAHALAWSWLAISYRQIAKRANKSPNTGGTNA